MNIKHIRKMNLSALIDERGGKNGGRTRLADQVGANPNNFSQLLGDRGGMSNELARRIERRLKLPDGWMDQSHIKSGLSPVSESGIKRIALVTWAEAAMAAKKKPPIVGENYEVIGPEVNPRTFALRVHDDSMRGPSKTHDFPRGCRILVDPLKRPQLTPPHNRVVVELEDGSIVLREWGGVHGHNMLIPLNAKFARMRVTSRMRVLGVVVDTRIGASAFRRV